MIRVLIISPSRHEKGGISTVVENLNGNRVDKQLLYSYYSTWENGPFLKKMFYSALKLLYFPLYLKMNKVDVIYIHFAHRGSFLRKTLYAKMSKWFTLPVIFHSHSSLFDSYYQSKSSRQQLKIKSVFENNCTKLIVLGRYWANFYTDEIGVPIDKIEILPNAVKIPPTYQYSLNSRVITMFGKMGYRKGSYDLIEVATYFNKQNSDITFKLYGDGEREKLGRMVKERGLDNIELYDWVDGQDKQRAMEEAGLNILPSYHEGLPMAILETMSLGIPNLSTNVGSIDDVIKKNHNGFLVTPGDIEEMTYQIEKFFYGSSDEKKRTVSKQARQTIKSNFDIEKYYLDLNQIILKTKTKRDDVDD